MLERNGNTMQCNTQLTALPIYWVNFYFISAPQNKQGWHAGTVWKCAQMPIDKIVQAELFISRTQLWRQWKMINTNISTNVIFAYIFWPFCWSTHTLLTPYNTKAQCIYSCPHVSMCTYVWSFLEVPTNIPIYYLFSVFFYFCFVLFPFNVCQQLTHTMCAHLS